LCTSGPLSDCNTLFRSLLQAITSLYILLFIIIICHTDYYCNIFVAVTQLCPIVNIDLFAAAKKELFNMSYVQSVVLRMKNRTAPMFCPSMAKYSSALPPNVYRHLKQLTVYTYSAPNSYIPIYFEFIRSFSSYSSHIVHIIIHKTMNLFTHCPILYRLYIIYKYIRM